MSQIYPDFAYNNPIQRGEIFLSTYVSEGYLEKLRPVVVIQNNLGNKHSRTIVVAAVTSKPKKELPVNVVIDPVKYGLEVENCTIMANQIFTIDKDYLRLKKGCLDAEDLKRLDEALIASLDLKNQEGKEMNEIQKIEKDGQRLLTTQQLAEFYEVEPVKLQQNYANNKERYQNGVHYFVSLHGEESYSKFSNSPFQTQPIYLWTKKGAFLHAKSLGTDRAWEVYEMLVNTYFQVKELVQTKPLSELEILKKSVDMLIEQKQKLAQVEDRLETVNHRINSLDAVNVEGDSQQRLVKMVQKLAYKAGITYSNAWNQFKDAFNMAYRTNLTARINNYCQVNNLKKITIPAYLAEFNQLEDGIRVADKLLNL